MSANRATFPISVMARVLGVSEAGYYAWLRRPPSAHAQADAVLLRRIRTVHASSRETYGAPRVHAELRTGGERPSGGSAPRCFADGSQERWRKRIARLMREAGLVGASRRRGGPVTTRRDKEARPAPDLVDRDFSATGPNQLWVADITFIPTVTGFLYLAVVLDAWSRKIVGWAMANHLRAELVLDALGMAVGQRRPRDVIHHSDQGSQYTSLAFGKRCKEAGVRPSLSASLTSLRGTASRWVRWAMRTTMRCARASSPHSNASCSNAAGSRRRPRRAWRASASSRAGTTRCGCTLPSATVRRWPTKQR